MVRVGSQAGLRARLAVHVLMVSGRDDRGEMVNGRNDRVGMVCARDARGETMIVRNVRRVRRSVVPTRFAAVQVGANTSVEKCRTSVPRKNDGSMRGQSASRRLEGSVTRLHERKRVVRASKRCNHVLLVH